MDTIKYHIWPRTPHGKVSKTKENITHERAKRSALSQQGITRLQWTDKTTCQTRNTNNKKVEFVYITIQFIPVSNTTSRKRFGNPSFHDRIGRITQKKLGYNIIIVRLSACQVINQIAYWSYGFHWFSQINLGKITKPSRRIELSFGGYKYQIHMHVLEERYY